ncbi:hypothetical protein [Tahibacter soli]|uniref:Sel1 repeat family protein n=1 Tax=Tahibacter soli TaxID=2983605 RepID=A0A9X3YKV8_9GAMM|nr:hypothetical protein [Tahibacter soli]MDC8013457.1 hypothetical protein [Tahibacter soli]
MRLLPLLFAGFAVTLATAASACPIFIPQGPRNAASIEYDRQYCAWQRALGERIATDPDPDVAWAGAALAVRDNCEATEPPALVPSPPTTAGGRLMQLHYCQRSGTCDDALARWRKAEPDNLYVLALAIENDEPVSDADFDRTTHYADGWRDVRRIVATVLARYDVAPPRKPSDYLPGPMWRTIDEKPADLVFPMQAMRRTLDALDNREPFAPALHAQFARILLAARDTPFAAEYGARHGIDDAVTDPVERRRYCTADARANENAQLLWELTIEKPDSPAAQRFADLLRDGNALDAIDAFAASLPLAQRPAPVNENDIDACVDEVDGEEDEDDVEPIEAIADVTTIP